MSGRKANLNFIDTRRNIGKRAKLLEETVGVLSLYEQERTPIPPIEDDRTMQLEVRKLNVELTCPVCLGILRETMTVMECLHRFCSECINTCLRLGKKECPTCRVHCASRRHMRRDPNFDALISTIYPRLDEFEEQADSWVKKINDNVNRSSLRDSVEAGMKRQAAAKAKVNRISARRPTPPKKPATPPKRRAKRKASPRRIGGTASRRKAIEGLRDNIHRSKSVGSFSSVDQPFLHDHGGGYGRPSFHGDQPALSPAVSSHDSADGGAAALLELAMLAGTEDI